MLSVTEAPLLGATYCVQVCAGKVCAQTLGVCVCEGAWGVGGRFCLLYQRAGQEGGDIIYVRVRSLKDVYGAVLRASGGLERRWEGMGWFV